MISLEQIDSEIIELEKKDTSYAVIERLSWLYTVRDHMAKVEEKTDNMTGSEFLETCSDVPINSLLLIISSHMDDLRAMYPKEYENILKKIKEL